MLRKLLLTIAVLAAMGGSVGYTAQARTFKSSAEAMKVIHWQKKEIVLQKKIVKTGHMWWWANQHIAYYVELDQQEVQSHRLYISTLNSRMQSNIRLFKQLKKKEENPYSGLHLPPHYSEWLCIHRYEGSWTDTDSPYWGGLQMDSGFQSTYAAAYSKTWHVPNPYTTLGTADHWPRIVQMWVAEEAFKSRGFRPWPNTAHYCGLL